MPRTLPEPPPDALNLTTILSALADPARRAILTKMHQETGPFDCRADTLGPDLGLSAPTISHHFRVLREAGLTRTVVNGRVRTMSVRTEDLEKRFPGLLDAVLGRD